MRRSHSTCRLANFPFLDSGIPALVLSQLWQYCWAGVITAVRSSCTFVVQKEKSCPNCVQAVGDAVSGILLVEAALRLLRLNMHDWATLYIELPSRQLKVCCSQYLPLDTSDGNGPDCFPV